MPYRLADIQPVINSCFYIEANSSSLGKRLQPYSMDTACALPQHSDTPCVQCAHVHVEHFHTPFVSFIGFIIGCFIYLQSNRDLHDFIDHAIVWHSWQTFDYEIVSHFMFGSGHMMLCTWYHFHAKPCHTIVSAIQVLARFGLVWFGLSATRWQTHYRPKLKPAKPSSKPVSNSRL